MSRNTLITSPGGLTDRLLNYQAPTHGQSVSYAAPELSESG